MHLQAVQRQCGRGQSPYRGYGIPPAPSADPSSGQKSVSLPERFHTASLFRGGRHDRPFRIFHVRKAVWGYAPDESLSIPDLLAEKYQGIRPAVGYPSLPDQSVNFILDELLDMKQIGITLTENGAMYPHASVCGLMFSHPRSHYFAVGKIGEDQLEDYARRRGKPIDEMRKFLAANLKS